MYVPIPLTHPAEINLAPYESISFGRVTGNMASDFKHYLEDELIRSSHLRIGDKSQAYRSLQEKILLESYRDAKRESNLGKTAFASIVINGNAESYYDEETSFKKETCERKLSEDEIKRRERRREKRGKKKGKEIPREIKYECTHYKRIGVLSTFGHMDFTEAQTGHLLISKNFSCKEEGYTTAIDESPPAINNDSMYEECLHQNVYEIFKTMSPWNENVKIPFEKDYDLPNLEAGIYLAQEGNLAGAVEVFYRELKAAEINPKIPIDSLVNAYWNMGLAYEYTWQFDKADAMFRRANELSSDRKFIKEIVRNLELKAEREELLKQLPHR